MKVGDTVKLGDVVGKLIDQSADRASFVFSGGNNCYHAPASAFTPVEEAKPERFTGNLFYDTSGGPFLMVEGVPLIWVKPRKIALDRDRIAAPVVLAKLKELREWAVDGNHSVLCNIYIRIEQEIAVLKKEVSDGK